MFRLNIIFLAAGVFLLTSIAFAVQQSKIEPRIVNGHDAKRAQFPYYVFLVIKLGKNSDSICGGSLISKQWVVTAAHCLNRNVQSIQVHLGSLSAYNVKEIGRKIFNIKSSSIKDHVHIHPKYSTLFVMK